MNIYREANTRLQGLPDMSLTVILLGIAVGAILLALFASPVLKGIAAGWFLFP